MEFILQWYTVMSRLSGLVADPIGNLATAINIPLVTALLLGLVGAASPCQLTTNASALAFVTRRAGSGALPLRLAVAYALGKMLVYTAVGSGAILLGVRLSSSEIVPVVVAARKAVGPLMLLVGLYLLGRLPLRLPAMARIEAWSRRMGNRGDATGAFALGAGFSFCFCPTMFVLFFGIVVPLGLRTAAGWLLPPAFAAGTALPLIGLTYAAMYAVERAAGWRGRIARLGGKLQRVAAIVFIVAGLNDTIVYWLL